MSSLDAMLKLRLCIFRYVNERDAHVKTDRVSRRCRPGQYSKSLISLVVGYFSTTGILRMKIK